MPDVTIEVKPKDDKPQTDKPEVKSQAIDPKTAITILGLLKNLPVGETVKGLLVKLFIFGFGIFCGIGIVYKSGLQPDAAKVDPPANVSVYQKRIDQLKEENDTLRKLLEGQQAQPVAPVAPVDPPQVQPQPKQPLVFPPVMNPKSGFVVPLK